MLVYRSVFRFLGFNRFPMTQDTVPPRDRWSRAFGTGLIAEIATIIMIVLTVMIYKWRVAPTAAEYTAFGQRAGAIIGPLGGAVFTFLFAYLLMRKITSRFVAHGVVVAIGAVALSIAGSLAGHGGIPAGYVLASALKLVAGSLAGVVYSRTAAGNRNVV